MKIQDILCLSAALVLSQSALAEVNVDGESLGKLQSVLDFCAQRNPQSAMKYRQLAKHLLQNATAQEVAEARRSGGIRWLTRPIAPYSANFPRMRWQRPATICSRASRTFCRARKRPSLLPGRLIMMQTERLWPGRTLLLAVALTGNLGVQSAFAQTKEAVAAKPAPAAVASAPRKTSPYHPEGVTKSARSFYQAVWGIDNLLVRKTASGNLIRFSYRVVEPERAKVLADKKATPYMIGQRSRAVLQVPVMDKVGQLRQSTGKPGAGEEFWMAFSNKGNPVKSGDRVDVVIGAFHAVGLMVE